MSVRCSAQYGARASGNRVLHIDAELAELAELAGGEFARLSSRCVPDRLVDAQYDDVTARGRVACVVAASWSAAVSARLAAERALQNRRRRQRLLIQEHEG